MSPRDLVVSAVAVLVVVGAIAWSARRQRTRGNRWTVQLAAGLVCGVAAALAVAVPLADVVPDAEEGLLVASATVALVVVGVTLAVSGRTRRERSQVPRS